MGRDKQNTMHAKASTPAPARTDVASPGGPGPDRYDGASFLGNPPVERPLVSPDIATPRFQRVD